MELVLALGYKSVAELDATMSQQEFNLWWVYKFKRMLPMRRTEMYLAQIASQLSLLGSAWGGTYFKISDFLFDEPAEKPVKKRKRKTTKNVLGTDVQALAAVSGRAVIRIGERRRQRLAKESKH